ncbi:MAG: hypothetical protein WCP55_24100, partial [Lentisphaerota bacterium]
AQYIMAGASARCSVQVSADLSEVENHGWLDDWMDGTWNWMLVTSNWKIWNLMERWPLAGSVREKME